MKRILSFFVLLTFAVAMYGQSEVTKFLGIPVDGYKQDMISKLKEKGFTYDSTYDCLNGEFNGSQVRVFVVTNNNKVWRIMVADANDTDETDIKARFNTLCRQFSNNKKYIPLNDTLELSDSEDISYEMTVNKKRYDAYFFQLNLTSGIGETTNNNDFVNFKRIVWFTITQHYRKYCICMYYDNEYNKANGEDL